MARILKWDVLPNLKVGAGPVRLVAVQDETVRIWTEEPDTAPQATRRVWINGTGWPLPEVAAEHVGSVMQGAFVWHVYREVA